MLHKNKFQHSIYPESINNQINSINTYEDLRDFFSQIISNSSARTEMVRGYSEVTASGKGQKGRSYPEAAASGKGQKGWGYSEVAASGKGPKVGEQSGIEMLTWESFTPENFRLLTEVCKKIINNPSNEHKIKQMSSELCSQNQSIDVLIRVIKTRIKTFDHRQIILCCENLASIKLIERKVIQGLVTSIVE